MKKTARILVFSLTLALAIAAVIVPGAAADDVCDFIGKDALLASDEPPVPNEMPEKTPVPRPSVGSLQSYNIETDHESRTGGQRLETKFEVAPALRGDATTHGLQPATQSTRPATQPISTAQDANQEPEPISEFIPPPNTGRSNYFAWGALSGAILLAALFVPWSKKAYQL